MSLTFNNKGRRSKYGNKKVTCFGLTFDSTKERDRYIVLRDAQADGIIKDLELQFKYELLPAITSIVFIPLKTKYKIETRVIQQPITYICDFRYSKNGSTVVEDVKISESLIPKEFVLKEKLFRYRYGFPIRKIFKASEPV